VPEPRHPLLLLPTAVKAAKAKRSGGPTAIQVPTRARQFDRLQPKFTRLEQAFNEQRAHLQEALEGAGTEQVVVLEVVGGVEDFYKAVRKAELQWLIDVDGDDVPPDEDFHVRDEPDTATSAKLFLILSDLQAIREILRLWRLYQEAGKDAFQRGLKKWPDVFDRLRDVRLWDISDRIEPDTRSYWHQRLGAGDTILRTEIELWYSDSDQKNVDWASELRTFVVNAGGAVLDTCELGAIRYHAFLADLPADIVHSLLNGEQSSLSLAGQIMYYRPQIQAMSLFAGPEQAPFGQQRPIPQGPPIVAILDGVPLQNHVLLAGRIVLDDPNNLQANAPAVDRVHGTSMTSIVLHGDLNGQTPTIGSRVIVHPILIPDPATNDRPRHEISVPNRLLLDVIHIAVKRLIEGAGAEPAISPTVRIINLSIGDLKREFSRSISPLARLLDWLAWKYKLLFVVPTGNDATVDSGLDLGVPRANFGTLTDGDRAVAALKAVERGNEFRRLLSPAESINSITVGGVYNDASTFTAPAGRFPLFPGGWPCPQGRNGPGFLRGIKPDVVAPSGRRLFTEKLGNAHANATVMPVSVATAPGILSACPSANIATLTDVKYSAGTSNAAALVSHTAAHVHDVIRRLREADAARVALPSRFDSVLLKALTVHSCLWPESLELREALNSSDTNDYKRRMARLFGYGFCDIDRAMGCTDERATLIAVGDIAADEGLEYRVPLPPSLSGKREWRRISITLAWLSPINSQHRDYRRALVWFTCDRSVLKAGPAGADHNAMRRGTVQHDIWTGEKASAYTDGEALTILVSCAEDAGKLTESVPFALCVSIEVASGVDVPIYQEIAARVTVQVPVPVR